MRILQWLALHTYVSSLPRDSSEAFQLTRQTSRNWHKNRGVKLYKLHSDNRGSHTVRACHLIDDRNRKGTVFSYLLQLNHTGLEFLVYFRIPYDTLWAVFPRVFLSPRIHLQDLWKRFQFVLDHNLGHFEANLFDRAEIVMEAGKNRRFQGRLNAEPRTTSSYFSEGNSVSFSERCSIWEGLGFDVLQLCVRSLSVKRICANGLLCWLA